MRGRWVAPAAMVLEWSFGGSGFIGGDAMLVRGHFLIFCSDSYVVNFVPYLVVVVTSLRKLCCCNTSTLKQLTLCTKKQYWQLIPLSGVICSVPTGMRQMSKGFLEQAVLVLAWNAV